MVLEFESCCFCGELRTGSLIIGYLTLLRDIIVSLISLIFLSLGASREIWISGVAIAVLCILLILGTLNVIFTTFLLIGIHEYKAGYLKAYLIYSAVVTVIAVLLSTILLIAVELPVLILLALLFLLIHVYYLLVIRSYYLKMDDPEKKPAIFHTPEGPPLTAENIA